MRHPGDLAFTTRMARSLRDATGAVTVVLATGEYVEGHATVDNDLNVSVVDEDGQSGRTVQVCVAAVVTAAA